MGGWCTWNGMDGEGKNRANITGKRAAVPGAAAESKRTGRGITVRPGKRPANPTTGTQRLAANGLADAGQWHRLLGRVRVLRPGVNLQFIQHLP